uniref:Uncharacterized protein n=1 Tax=Tanacetum cinerariifolium TaxID=118510 RepID=A0A6L2KRY1_TANCI|nr:hypothetical protein [Tanacetum cinerariifolium]
MSFDDLYNNFKIVKQEVRGIASSSSSLSYQNIDFVSSPSSTNKVNTAYGVCTANTQVSPASTQVSTASTQDNTANLSDATVYAFLANDEVPTNMALIDFSDSKVYNDKTCLKSYLKSFKTFKTQLADLRIEFNKSEFNLATYKRGLSYVEQQLVFYKKNKVIFGEQLAVLKRDISYKDSEISMFKSELEKIKQEKENNQLKIENFDNASKSLDKLIGTQIPDKSRKGVGFVSYTPPHTGLFSPLKLNLANSGLEEFQQPEFERYRPKTSKNVSEDISNDVRESPDAPLVEELVLNDKLEKKTIFSTVAKIEFVRPKQQGKPARKLVKMTSITIKGKGWNMVPKAFLMKIGLRPLNTVRPVNTDHPKFIVYSARPMSRFSKSAQSTGLPQKEDQGYVNSRCSRHMTGNMSYLSDFKEFDRGYVTFGGGVKGGKITGKGTLKTGKLDFEDVYFVKELHFNLFSVSQMCDKKNSVLFSNTGCFVLSPDFKLADESQVLLKVPRKNNMYNVDMKNIIPKESLTCLVAKATLDESMLWHRRLGHVNFKTINKLVKENIVRGLPTKHFENDQTCVACLKGKQHKASSTKDETSGILKNFRTEIENLVDKKRRNRTLIEAAKTMIADSKLPTIFWVEAVNTVCYVQNRVLVVKPHNKTLYELFRGRTPALSFMRPFGCHVIILNTLDYLGKFDGKSDEGFFVGYSLNSKAFRVYNIRTRKVEENLHIRFLDDNPIIADGSLFDSSSKNASNDEPQPSSDARKKDDEGVSKESGIDNQERPENNTQDVNTIGLSINTASINVNTGSLNINNVSPIVITAPLEATHVDFFGDETEVNMSNITTTYLVLSTPTTRIHKDHSLDHVIGDVQSSGADEELSDGGSSRVIVYGYDGLPMLPVAPPSPDYIPGPEEPETPPAPQDEDKHEHEPMFIQPYDPNFVPEPIYPEYIPLEDEHILSAEEQPLPPVGSPTAESLGYVVESDPEEDPEEYEDDETEDG